jgi:hypothetical protein
MWQRSVGLAETLQTVLEKKRLPAVCVNAIPNARLVKAEAAQKLIEASDEGLAISAVRRQLDELQCESVDPDQFWQWGATHGYEVSVGWGSSDLKASFDAQMLDLDRSNEVFRVAPKLDRAKPREAYANDPLENSIGQELILELREFLQSRLEKRLIPADWIVRRHLPLTRKGVPDRSAF